MKSELDAACLRWWNASEKHCDAICDEMMEIGHRIIDTPAHSAEGMRLKIGVRARCRLATRLPMIFCNRSREILASRTLTPWSSTA
jgi:hypothetical protein